MRALPAIYEQGRIMFPFDFPEYEGPVSVLVVFPSELEHYEHEPEECDDELPW